MENLKQSNELLEAIGNGTAFDKETGLIWSHWLDSINEQVVKNNVDLADVRQQRELLIAWEKWKIEEGKMPEYRTQEQLLNDYLSNL